MKERIFTRIMKGGGELCFIMILTLSAAGCSSEPAVNYIYFPPEETGDGLVAGAMDYADIDSRLLEKAVNDINRGKYQEIHSLLIYRDGMLVFEEYFKGHKYKWDAPYHHGAPVVWKRYMPHHVQSVTKSITSLCIGIAVDRGFIGSVDQSIFDYLPEYRRYGKGGKENITIEHLLTMTSGLEWAEWNAPYSSQDNDIINTWFQDDQLDYILGKPLVAEPGTKFNYSGGGMVLLGEILRNATGMKIDEFSEKYLFSPMGIKSADWVLSYRNGMIESSGGLKLTPRDMIKIGAMILNKGVWNGRRILSEQWVEKSAVPYKDNNGIIPPETHSGINGYSYSWWTRPFCRGGRKIEMFYAGGWGGQYIMVFPELDMVVVFTGGNYVGRRQQFHILKKYILPAVR